MILTEAPVSNSMSNGFLSISTGNNNYLQLPREWAIENIGQTTLSSKFSLRSFFVFFCLQFFQIMDSTLYLLLFHFPPPFTTGLRVHCTPLFLLPTLLYNVIQLVVSIIMRFPMKTGFRGVIGFTTSNTFRRTSTHFIYNRVTMYHSGLLSPVNSAAQAFSMENCKVNAASDSSLRWIERTFKPHSNLSRIDSLRYSPNSQISVNHCNLTRYCQTDSDSAPLTEYESLSDYIWLRVLMLRECIDNLGET